MPSLSAGTNWTLTGRLVNYPGIDPSCNTPSVPVSYLVVVASAGDLATTYSSWNGSSLDTNLKQQQVTFTVTRTVGGVSTVHNYWGLFEKGAAAVGSFVGYDTDGNQFEATVLTSDSVCSGKQALRGNFTNPGASYSTLMGYTCRNNNLL